MSISPKGGVVEEEEEGGGERRVWVGEVVSDERRLGVVRDVEKGVF